MIRLYCDKKYKFFEKFNTETGFYIRSGVLAKNSEGKIVETKIDPFMRSYPSLLDIGVMGECQHGQRGLCLKASTDCYQSGSKLKKSNMSFTDYESILKQCKGSVFQIALGGRGDVNKHEDFDKLIKLSRDYDIVPNYTTSGFNLTDDEVATTKKHVGAVAVSMYNQPYTYDAISMFIDANIKTNIHFVLSKKSIDEAINLIKTDSFPKGINAVVFLLYKPVGEGQDKFVLDVNDSKVINFFNLIDEFKGSYKIGVDSCSIPGIINLTKKINTVFVDTCEGARFSAYISSEMEIVPCSFDQTSKWGIDLKNNTIKEAWNSDLFNQFRYSLKNSCMSCIDRKECFGGCPIKRQVVLCDRSEKNLID